MCLTTSMSIGVGKPKWCPVCDCVYDGLIHSFVSVSKMIGPYPSENQRIPFIAICDATALNSIDKDVLVSLNTYIRKHPAACAYEILAKKSLFIRCFIIMKSPKKKYRLLPSQRMKVCKTFWIEDQQMHHQLLQMLLIYHESQTVLNF